MKRTPLRPSSSPIRANRTRKAKEFARAYHSVERVEWVKARSCVAASRGCRWPMDNMHVTGDGAGRKADYQMVVAACRHHHSEAHAIGTQSFEERYGVCLVDLAVETQIAWMTTQ